VGAATVRRSWRPRLQMRNLAGRACIWHLGPGSDANPCPPPPNSRAAPHRTHRLQGRLLVGHGIQGRPQLLRALAALLLENLQVLQQVHTV